MNLELEILKVLEGSHPRMLKKKTLIADVQLSVDDFTHTAFERKLVILDEKGQIRIHKGEDVTRVVITDEGLNRLAESR